MLAYVCVHIGPRIKQHSKRTDTTPIHTHSHKHVHAQRHSDVGTVEQATSHRQKQSKINEHNYRNSKEHIHARIPIILD